MDLDAINFNRVDAHHVNSLNTTNIVDVEASLVNDIDAITHGIITGIWANDDGVRTNGEEENVDHKTEARND